MEPDLDDLDDLDDLEEYLNRQEERISQVAAPSLTMPKQPKKVLRQQLAACGRLQQAGDLVEALLSQLTEAFQQSLLAAITELVRSLPR